MKKCPKCGADNRPDSSACYNCFASLEGVPVTEAPPTSPTGPPEQPQVPPTDSPSYIRQTSGPIGSVEESGEPVSVVGQPLGGQQNQPRPVYGPRPIPPAQARRGEFRHPEPLRTSNVASTLGTIFLLLVLLGGGGFAYWKFIYIPSTPINVMRSFIKIAQSDDTDKANKYLTKASQEQVESVGLDVINQLKIFESLKEGEDYVLEQTLSDKTTATVKMKFNPTSADELIKKMIGSSIPGISNTRFQKFKDATKRFLTDGESIVLTKEEGKWRIDLAATDQANAAAMENMMKNL